MSDANHRDAKHRDDRPGLTYAESGVHIAESDAALDAIKAIAAPTYGPEVVSGVGGFGGLFELGRYRQPLLVASTDGVGTKAMVASATRRLSTIGIDLVAMCVDDLVCHGAAPLFMLDYLAVSTLEPESVEELVSGVAKGCSIAGCALLGGETAEHPGGLEETSFDLAGFALGVVERDEVIGPERVSPGDKLVGLLSPGLRCNGYSLARRALLEVGGRSLDQPAFQGSDSTLADELLAPSLVYAPAVLAAIGECDVHAAAHVTGGGIPGNLSRAIPAGCDAVVDRSSWEVPRIFEEVRELGRIDQREMETVFNLGVGMVLVVGPSDAGAILSVLRDNDRDARVIGEVVVGEGEVRLAG